MSKVKERRGRRSGSTAGKTSRRRPRTAQRATPERKARSASRAIESLQPVRSVKIRELDPLRKCGPGTSVQRLFRVDETLRGALTTHLVFLDRHGWYCEHGRACGAVADVRKLGTRRMGRN